MTTLNNFADKLVEAIRRKNSVVCVGLDPRVNRIPSCIMREMAEHYDDPIQASAHAIVAFNKGIIDAVKDIAVVVKPQSAFYEQLGFQGIWALEETCKYAQEQGLLVLLDAKRGDIGSTAEAYAKAYLSDVAPVDALTINAYLGTDGVLPFLDMCGDNAKGLFILVKTSNPSSGDIQDRVTAEEEMSIAQLMGHFVSTWGFDHIGEEGYSSIGGVVGATFPKEAEKIRAVMPQAFFLVPGYGAQGGTAEDVRSCFNEDGLGAIISSSRGITNAFEQIDGPEDGSHYADVAREAAEAMRDALNYVRKVS